jgi:hypothetical protein
LNWNLLILRERIFDSRVEAGMPSLAAAPLAPEIFPLLCASAASIRWRSFDFRSVAAVDDCGSLATQLLSIENSFVSPMMRNRGQKKPESFRISGFRQFT